ncbi:MAG: hypothetical protein EA343_00350 [Nodularia sp. (in: Bacteria)]|nr:MAG: hypothetical protein EA343_00350 [Nodularia sp. (in: cyanobacteria)]
MNIQQLRQSVKVKWLSYYEQNRSWLVKIRVWGTYNGLRRPSSGFILATLSVLEPQFDKVISFILDLNDNPDKIVTALGLDFNPDEELRLITSEDSTITTQFETESLQEEYPESKPVPLLTVAPKIFSGETLTSDLPRLDKPVLAFTENIDSIYTEENISSVAVATKVAPPAAAKTVNSAKSPSSLLRENKPVRSPLAITIDVLNKAKTLPSHPVRNSQFAHVPIKFGTVLLKANCLTGILFLRECFKPTVRGNNNHGKMPPKPKNVPRKVNPSLSNRASSLASWVDEFCQGSEYDPETAISIRL